MQFLRFMTIGLFATALVACGGGGSDGGGGGGGGTIFTGTATITLSAPGIPPVTTPGGITITVSSTSVTVSDGVDSGTAPISADGTKFSVPVAGSDTTDGVTCGGTIIFNGTIMGTSITGPLTGSGSCTGFGPTLPVTVSGSFSATMSGSAKSPSGSGLGNALKNMGKAIQ